MLEKRRAEHNKPKQLLEAKPPELVELGPLLCDLLSLAQKCSELFALGAKFLQKEKKLKKEREREKKKKKTSKRFSADSINGQQRP